MTEVFAQDFYVIGQTAAGHRFQPSDWAERICGSLSTLRGRRVIYSPLLMPVMKNGVKALRVASELHDQYPEIFKEIVEFSKKNQLQVEACHDHE
jgi:hypothetical protein